MIRVKRAYEAGTEEDGARFLVERLWPRGIKKEDLSVEAGLKSLHRVQSCESGLITIQQNGTSSVRDIAGNWRSILLPGGHYSLGLDATV